MPDKRIRSVRLTREERLEVRRLISEGISFEEAAGVNEGSRISVVPIPANRFFHV